MRSVHLNRAARFILALVGSSLLFSPPLRSNAAEIASGGVPMFVVNPQLVGPSQADVSGPGRGYASFYEASSGGLPEYYDYRRFSWRQIEPSENQYNLTLIEYFVQQAAAQGKKFAFGIMPVIYDSNGQDSVGAPDYLIKALSRGFYFKKPTGGSCYVPDWNDPIFIQRTAALAQALASKYDGDRRIGWVDMGSYGVWGEWQVSQIPYNRDWPPGPNWMTSVSGAKDATVATKHALIDAFVNSFHNTQLLMDLNETEGSSYAMSRSPYIGIRRDSLGNADFHDLSLTGADFNDLDDPPTTLGQVIQGRWKTAPFIGEFMGTPSDDLNMAIQDAKNMHLSVVEYENVGPAKQQLAITLGQKLGYRYQVTQAMIPTTIGPGTQAPVDLLWNNAGITPVYSNWNVQIQLRAHNTGTILASGTSRLQLRSVLPNSPIWDQVLVPVPATVWPQPADVIVKITDPTRFWPPLPLGISGRQSDGSYNLGTVSVGPIKSGYDMVIPRTTPSAPAPTQPIMGSSSRPSAPVFSPEIIGNPAL